MNFSIKIDQLTQQKYMAVNQKGKTLLNNPFINKGQAFTEQERHDLNLHGLVAPAVSTIEDQLVRNYENFSAEETDIGKYNFLSSLHDRNETLFFRFLYEHIEEVVPIIYTPVVGEVCQKFSHIYRRGRGLYITYKQMGMIGEILGNFYFSNPSVIVVTDGERILGLGDQGADGMAIPVGKLSLYTLCAGISPYSTLPIMLDAGTDNEERRNDPLYLGIRHERIRGHEYQVFIDKFVNAVSRLFPDVLLQWEDLQKVNAINQLNRFRDALCSFNDDIQGTGSAVLAYIYRALKITGRPVQDSRIVLVGAGAAAYGIANLFKLALQEKGISPREARMRIWMVDKGGLVTKGRDRLEVHKVDYARDLDEINSYDCVDRSRINLEEVISNIKPNILIGTSSAPGIFNESVLRLMGNINEHPIIFPLSNPTSKCECTPEDAIRISDGRAIVATGSPFSPVDYRGKRYHIGQCNNFFIFPGVGLGVVVGGIRRLTDNMFLTTAKALADEMGCNCSEEKSLYLDIRRIREYSYKVACSLIRSAIEEGYADNEVLANLEEKVRNAMWFPEYLPVRYEDEI